MVMSTPIEPTPGDAGAEAGGASAAAEAAGPELRVEPGGAAVGPARPRAHLWVDNVSVIFDGFKALTDLTLTLDKGELRCIIGPNGAGKTTLMDVITGKTRPTLGGVYLLGENREQVSLTKMAEHQVAQLGIGRKFQRPTVFQGHTVFENIELSLGPVVLGLFAEPYDVIVFNERVHGFGTAGSLGRALLRWSRRSPWGWAAWQLAIVGLLALLAGAVRFGPIRSLSSRRRRSPMEHVNALATALSARGGHDVAIAALIRGLRRRLAPTQPAAADPGAWLRELVERAPTPTAKEQAGALLALSAPGQSGPAVLMAANAVEDLWEEMHR